jgi:transcriptional regulator GlxA family with amidase domain
MVCAGAFLLGAVGLLDHHDATTHWSAIDELARHVPAARVQQQVRWVGQGSLVTAAGISTATSCVRVHFPCSPSPTPHRLL